MKFFSLEWAEELKKLINQNQEYKNSSEGWEWTLILSIKDAGGDRLFFLDLFNGECKDVRTPTEKEFIDVNFLISATKKNWEKILTQSLSPMQALMMKNLTIEKGNMSDLLPYVNSLKELLNSAMMIKTEFD